MFRVTQSGLPADPTYPNNLTELGYFVNDIDEIRSIANPTWYFKYFITKNQRHNVRQREAMNTAIRNIIDERLSQVRMVKYHCSGDKVEKETEKMKKATPDEAVPHIPIWASKNIGSTPRVIVLFGESFQDMGVFAQRIIGLHGGINAGSTVNLIRTIQGLEIDSDTGAPIPESKTASMRVKLTNPEEIDLTDLTTDHPGIILANTGQLRWCRSQGQGMTQVSWDALPRPTAVDPPVRWDPIKNTVPGHRDISAHVGSVLTHVITQLCTKTVKLDVIAIGDACQYVPLWLDQNWDSVKTHVASLACIVPDFADRDAYRNEEFKHFLAERTRGFVQDSEMPAGSALFGPNGGAKKWQRAFGYNVYSVPAEMADEMVFPRYFEVVLRWIQGVAEGGEGYCEDEIAHVDLGADDEGEEDGPAWKVGESGYERGLFGADSWAEEEGIREMVRRGEEREAAVKAERGEEEYQVLVEAEKKRVQEENEKFWGEDVELDTKSVEIDGLDAAQADAGETEKKPFKVDPKTGLRIYEIAETDTEHPELYEWHTKPGTEVEFRWLTKEETEENIKKEKLASELKLKERQAAAAKRKEDSTTVSPGEAALPPTPSLEQPICSKASVESATHTLIADLGALDIAAHTKLPATPQGGPGLVEKRFKIVNRTPFDDISDGEEEFPARRGRESVGEGEGEGLAEGKGDGGKNGADEQPHMDEQPVPESPSPAIESNPLPPSGVVCAHRPLNTSSPPTTKVAKPITPLDIQSFDGTGYDEYQACPPERMERLPIEVAEGLHRGSPEVELSREEKARVLQCSVVGSPVREGEGEGGEERKISVVSLEGWGV